VSEEKEWYAVYTKSRQEYKALAYLKALNFNVFLPEVEVIRVRRGRRVKVRRPMFPGYLFVETDWRRESRLDIVRAPSIIRVLGYDDRPTPIPREQVESLQIVVRSGTRVDPHPYLKVGQRVRIVSGALRDVVGILVEKSRNSRKLVISVDMMNRAVAVTIEDASMVEPYE